MTDYSDRNLHSVRFGLINPASAGEDSIGINVSFTLSASHDRSGMGPEVVVQFAIPGSNDMSLNEINSRAAELAHAVVRRVASASQEEILEASNRPSDFDFSKK